MSRCEQIKRLQSRNKWMSFTRVIDLFLQNSLQKHSQVTIIKVTTGLSDILWIYNSFSIGCNWIFLFYRLECGLRTPEIPNDQLFTSPKTDPNCVRRIHTCLYMIQNKISKDLCCRGWKYFIFNANKSINSSLSEAKNLEVQK